LPYPLTSGGHQAIYNGIRCMNDMGNLYLTYKVYDDNVNTQEIAAFENIVGNIKVIPYVAHRALPVKRPLWIRGAKKIIRAIGTVPTKPQRDPFSGKYSCDQYPQAFLEHICKIINDYKIDVVQIEHFAMLPLVCVLPQKVKKFFVHHEIRYVRNELELAEIGTNLYRDTAVQVNKIIEIGLLNKYDAIITLSEIDKEKLVKNGVTKPIYASLAIVDTDQPKVAAPERYTTLTFVGPEVHLPNKTGLLWFLDNCWKGLLSKDGTFHLNIIGNWKDSTKKEFLERYENIEFLGFVPDLNAAISGTTMIVPITVGSGIRMKILEAATMNVPFVTTSVGVEGLPFTSGKECFITDDPEEFVSDIEKLQDPVLRQRFTKGANAFVKSHYSYDVLKRNRDDIYQDILK